MEDAEQLESESSVGGDFSYEDEDEGEAANTDHPTLPPDANFTEVGHPPPPARAEDRGIIPPRRKENAHAVCPATQPMHTASAASFAPAFKTSRPHWLLALPAHLFPSDASNPSSPKRESASMVCPSSGKATSAGSQQSQTLDSSLFPHLSSPPHRPGCSAGHPDAEYTSHGQTSIPTHSLPRSTLLHAFRPS